jgi:hypothetical protein
MTVNVNEVRATIRGQIWQTFAQSGINFSVVPKADLEKLVDQITDDVLKQVNNLLGESGAVPELLINRGAMADTEEEQELWRGRPFLSIFEHYTVTNQRIRIVSGFLGRDHENIELVRINDLDWDHSLVERALGIGDIFLHSVDRTDPDAVLRNVSDPAKVFEIIRRAMLAARARHHVIYEQQM